MIAKFLTTRTGWPGRTIQRLELHARSRGFSLIEVLVALVVLSIGLLGVAALQVSGLRTGRTAINGMRAVILAGDIADRVRANPAAAQDYVVALGGNGSATPVCVDTPAGPAGADCTAAQMAAYDIWEWKAAMAPTAPNGLPAGDGSLEVDLNVIPPVHTVTIEWEEDGETFSYRLEFH